MFLLILIIVTYVVITVKRLFSREKLLLYSLDLDYYFLLFCLDKSTYLNVS